MVKRLFGLIVTVGAFLLAGGFQTASAQSWTEFHSKEGAFSILLPSKPARQSNPTSTPIGTIDIAMFTASTDSAFYVVTYSDFPSAQQPDWVEFSSAEGDFTVSMPGRPDKETVPVPGEKISMYFFSHTTEEGLAYIASYADMKLDLGAADKVKMFLDGVREGQVKSNKANKLVNEQAITFEGHPGRELLIETPAGINTVRVYLVGNRVYQLFFVRPSGYQDTEKRGQRFLDSFKLTKR